MAPHEDTDAASEPNSGTSVPPNTSTTANWGALRVSYIKKHINDVGNVYF